MANLFYISPLYYFTFLPLPSVRILKALSNFEHKLVKHVALNNDNKSN